VMLTSLHQMEASLVVATPVTDTRRVVASSQKKKNTKQVQVSSKGQASKTYNVRKDTIETKQNKQTLLPITISTCAVIGNRIWNDEEIQRVKEYRKDFETFEDQADTIEKFVLRYEAQLQLGHFVDKYIVENYLSEYKEHEDDTVRLYEWVKKLVDFITSLEDDETGDQQKQDQTEQTQTIHQFSTRAVKYNGQLRDLHARIRTLREKAHQGLKSIIAEEKKAAEYIENSNHIDKVCAQYIHQINHKYESFLNEYEDTIEDHSHDMEKIKKMVEIATNYIDELVKVRDWIVDEIKIHISYLQGLQPNSEIEENLTNFRTLVRGIPMYVEKLRNRMISLKNRGQSKIDNFKPRPTTHPVVPADAGPAHSQPDAHHTPPNAHGKHTGPPAPHLLHPKPHQEPETPPSRPPAASNTTDPNTKFAPTAPILDHTDEPGDASSARLVAEGILNRVAAYYDKYVKYKRKTEDLMDLFSGANDHVFIGYEAFNQLRHRVQDDMSSMRDYLSGQFAEMEALRDANQNDKKDRINKVMTEMMDWERNVLVRLRNLQKHEYDDLKQKYAWNERTFYDVSADDILSQMLEFCNEYQNLLYYAVPDVIDLQLHLTWIDESDTANLKMTLDKSRKREQEFENATETLMKKINGLQQTIQAMAAKANTAARGNLTETAEQKILENVNWLIKRISTSIVLNMIHESQRAIQKLLGHHTTASVPAQTHTDSSDPKEHTHTHSHFHFDPGHPEPKKVDVNFHAELTRFAQTLLAAAFPPTPAEHYQNRKPPITRGAPPAVPAALFPATDCPALHALCARVAHITAVSTKHPPLAATRFALELGVRSALVRLARQEVRSAMARAGPAARAALEKSADALAVCISDSALRPVLVAARSAHYPVPSPVVPVVTRHYKDWLQGHSKDRSEHNEEKPTEEPTEEIHREKSPPRKHRHESSDEIQREESPPREQKHGRQSVKEKIEATTADFTADLDFMSHFERELDAVANAKP